MSPNTCQMLKAIGEEWKWFHKRSRLTANKQNQTLETATAAGAAVIIIRQNHTHIQHNRQATEL